MKSRRNEATTLWAFPTASSTSAEMVTDLVEVSQGVTVLAGIAHHDLHFVAASLDPHDLRPVVRGPDRLGQVGRAHAHGNGLVLDADAILNGERSN